MILRKKIVITLAAPWLTRGNLVGLFGIDAPLARTPDNEHFILPGTLIVGKLAEAFRHLGEAGVYGYESDLTSYFGHNSSKDDDFPTAREGRRQIFVSDLECKNTGEAPAENRARIAVDGLDGTVTEGALQIIEQPSKPGQTVMFEGGLRVVGVDENTKAFVSRIERALEWITQFGGGRTFGFGASLCARLSPANSLEVPNLPPAKQRVQLKLSLHDLLCVGDKRTSANTYMSSAVIPGGAIKGALAHQILKSQAGKAVLLSDLKEGEFKTLAAHFSKLRISHAFPVEKGKVPARPRRIPLSWSIDDDKLGDCTQVATPIGKFQPDWKDPDWELASKAGLWSEPDTHLRLRTQIDTEHRAAMDGRLFAIGYRRCDTHDWIADIDFDGTGAERDAIMQELNKALAQGLTGIGRGGAFATIEWLGAEERPTIEHGTVIMTLQTPALLRKPEPGKTGDVTEHYRAAFVALDAPGTLKEIFVREQLRGAGFMAKRLPENTDYRPWLLTEPGSVFVFDNVTDVTKLEEWLLTGLPIPTDTLAFYGLEDNDQLWKYCPWLPENGYGEIAFGPTPMLEVKP